ncbi:MAG: 3'-5' exonuclease [Flavobacteriales bacterium]|nr:3'-5' exonuclease [Flavobacteriales bacterium]MCC6936906.1 3'-5' exonuclease [Flavobacteriales bacterium]
MHSRVVHRSSAFVQPLATPPIPFAYDGAMSGSYYAVLDVETTEGDPTNGRVMEVAVLAMNGRDERLRWDSLVHPRCRVPWFTKKLTGIDDELLRNAPVFSEVVRTLETLTQDRIVVAHNVRFDMTALAHEFARTGMPFERPTLCTERLGRRLVPTLEHYNLGSLCRYFGIEFNSAHRALADAAATASLLACYIDAFGEENVQSSVVPIQRALRA